MDLSKVGDGGPTAIVGKRNETNNEPEHAQKY